MARGWSPSFAALRVALLAPALVVGCSAASNDAGGAGTDSGPSRKAQVANDVQDTGLAPPNDEVSDTGAAEAPEDLESDSDVDAGAAAVVDTHDSGPALGTHDSGPVVIPNDSGPGKGVGHDASDEAGHDSGAPMEVDASCAPAVSPVVETDPDGPGYDCMTASCHLPGTAVQGGLTITVSGTLYDSKGMPLAGATIDVVDSMGKTLVLTSDNNANFWSGISDGKVLPAGNYGTCLTYVKCYPPGPFEGACQCATYAAPGALKATSVSMCPSGTATCTSLGAGASNGDCHTCHGTMGSPPAIHLP